jgi:hemin uptake protein HemP
MGARKGRSTSRKTHLPVEVAQRERHQSRRYSRRVFSRTLSRPDPGVAIKHASAYACSVAAACLR